jgi:DHA1 family tetracycline resistance protein-like MFS transporter
MSGTVFVMLAFVADPALALGLAPMGALGAVVVPSLQGLMSRAVPADRQGALQGVVASARAVSMILGPLVMTSIFFAFTREGAALHLPGAAFVLSAAIMVVCGALIVAGGPAPGAAAGERGRNDRGQA